MFQKKLEELGLQEKEATVYLALLEVEHDSVLDLAEKTGINRTTIYPVLEDLIKKGLVSEIQIDKKTRFRAEPVDRFELYLDRQKAAFEEKSKQIRGLLPELKSLRKGSDSSIAVKVIESADDVIRLAKELKGFKKVCSPSVSQACDIYINKDEISFLTQNGQGPAVTIKNKDIAETVEKLMKF